MNRQWAPETRVVHAGSAPAARPTVDPVYLSTTFLAADPEELDAILGGRQAGFSYGRHDNPTLAALAEAVNELEGGQGAVVYASGMGALLGALLAVRLQPGDRLLVSRDVYGATLNLARDLLGTWGIRVVTGDLVDLAAAAETIRRERPRAVLFEILTNPLMRVVDGPAVAALAREAGAAVVVDNTFTTPLMTRPLEWGADLVVHSATKYLGGHGDALGGVVVAGPGPWLERLRHDIRLTGAVPGPMEAWLLLRGLRTLALRFPRQCASAAYVAGALAAEGRPVRVFHPVLARGPEAERVARLFPAGLAGAAVSLDLGVDTAGVYEFLRRLRLILPGTTVGDIYSLCLYPKMASHRSLTVEERQALGIGDGLVRISVGIEDPEDILADIRAALPAGSGTARETGDGGAVRGGAASNG
ncbi:L-methionine gamma-lyase [Candidatus Hydrogenisulfobacillus filiaventi]|uniref:homocysteine desulfhydrase n=1 Tax=Candidatus Hydrogenisulfobacillus filiaventi TaxID=2707344 RepID=A0A6F8ZHX7_9FIRM|nr:L-methionine gamma-lyase [Candidatus Hydrogenisulfobacillus filiaventi]